MLGTMLGRYRLDGKLGEGGMGVVWRAYDPHLGRTVALKVLRDSHVADVESRARLLREARAAAALSHPHILTVYDVGEADGHVYIAMEYVAGRPLSEVVGERGLPTDEALRLGGQVVSALAHAHERGIVHRDVKPLNVLVTSGGDTKVLDFGLATRIVSDGGDTQSLDLTQPGSLVGTPDAMAPEVWGGTRADARSDVWAFGALLHALLTGAPPFRGRTRYELSTAICTADPAPLPERVPAAVRALVARCLAKDPQRRFRSAVELQAAFDAISAGELAGRQPRSGAGIPAWRQRRWALPALATVLLLVVAAGFIVLARSRRLGNSREPIESLAVLPLENFSHDREQQYFADGMTEELITRLAQLGVVRVISRTSAMQFRGTTQSLPAIARQLGVDAVVEGSVEQVGGRVRITAQLVYAKTDEHLWARSYEREVGDALALQDEIASAISHEIRGTLAASAHADDAHSAEPAAAHAPSASVPEAAMQAYLRGRDAYQTWTSEGSLRALQYFDQALAIDSTFAQALASRAASLLMVSRSPDTVALARAAITEALRRAPQLGEAHAALAKFLFENDWNWAESEREFRRAIALNPNDADAHHHYSHLLAALGRVPEANEQARLMLTLDPLAPASLNHMNWLDYNRGRRSEADADFRKLVDLAPGYEQNYVQYASQLFSAQRWGELLQTLELARKRGFVTDPLIEEFARAAMNGRTRQAAALLPRLRSASDPFPHDWTEVATGWVILGKEDEAFAALDSAYADHSYYLLFTNLDPAFASLRSDPRYAALRHRMRLPV